MVENNAPAVRCCSFAYELSVTLALRIRRENLISDVTSHVIRCQENCGHGWRIRDDLFEVMLRKL
jgi:hypothetical protein